MGLIFLAVICVMVSNVAAYQCNTHIKHPENIGATYCGPEGDDTECEGGGIVYYGSGDYWYRGLTLSWGESVKCTDDGFGCEMPGQDNECWIQKWSSGQQVPAILDRTNTGIDAEGFALKLSAKDLVIAALSVTAVILMVITCLVTRNGGNAVYRK